MAGLKEKLLSERKELLGSNCALNFSKNPLVILRGTYALSRFSDAEGNLA